MRHHEMLWDSRKHHETLWDTMRHYETPWDTMRHHETSWDTMRHHETPWDTMRHHEIPWDTIRHRETYKSLTHHEYDANAKEDQKYGYHPPDLRSQILLANSRLILTVLCGWELGDESKVCLGHGCPARFHNAGIAMLSYVPMHEEKRGEIGRGREEAYEPLAVLMRGKKM